MDKSEPGLNFACFILPLIVLALVFSLVGSDEPGVLVVPIVWLVMVLASVIVLLRARSRLVRSAAKTTFFTCLAALVCTILYIGFLVWAFRDFDLS